jgi:hypothetical protein
MLDEYRRAFEHSQNLPVHTAHGPIAEALFRSWLESFLPKKYGVTSGYVRGQRLSTAYDYAHFDVIIYDQINSPFLWTEVTPDKSTAGTSRIIPAEYVRAVLEVKANLTDKSVELGFVKLAQLRPFANGVDPPGELYPTFLPRDAVVGLVFFEVRNSAANSKVLDAVRDFDLPRPLYGIVVLSGEGREPDDTAIIRLTVSQEPQLEAGASGGLLGGWRNSASVQRDGQNYGSMIMWSPLHFSQFAFDLLAIINGRYLGPGRLSSFFGIDFGKYPEHKNPGSG